MTLPFFHMWIIFMDVAVLGWGTYLMTPTKVEASLLLHEEWDYLHYCVPFLLNPLSNSLNFPFKVVGSDPLLHFALIRLPYKWAFLLPYFLFLPSSSHLLNFPISCVPNFGMFFLLQPSPLHWTIVQSNSYYLFSFCWWIFPIYLTSFIIHVESSIVDHYCECFIVAL